MSKKGGWLLFVNHSCVPSVPFHMQASLHFSKGPALCFEHVEWLSLSVLSSPFSSLQPGLLYSSCAVRNGRGVLMCPGRCWVSFFLSLLWGPASSWVSVKQLVSFGRVLLWGHVPVPLTRDLPHFFSLSWLPFADTPFWAMILPFFQCRRPESIFWS